MSFQPTLDRVLVRPIEAAKTTAGGILLPEHTTQNKLAQAEVVTTGAGVYQNGILVPVELEAGDVVTYVRGSGVEVTSDYEKLLLLREGDVLGYESNDEVFGD